MNSLSHKFSVAPMMDWTDSPCRVLHRCLTKNALLYTEMVTADAVLHGDRARLLGFEAFEHPLALQLGGSDPAKLAQAAKIAADFGYDEVNLNVGCPSDRVQSGRFGACLMREPQLVADCVAAMRAAVSLPVTVKCRIGVDDQDPEAGVARADRRLRGRRRDACSRCMPARPGWKDCRPRKTATCRRWITNWSIASSASGPNLTILVNGGIETLEQSRRASAPCRWRDAGPRRLSESGSAGRGGCALLRRRADGSGCGGRSLYATMSSASWRKARGCTR